MNKIRLIPIERILGTLLMVLAIGGGGYYFGLCRASQVTSLGQRQMLPLDYFLNQRSFSEVEEAKALLQAATERFVTELRTRPDAGVLTPISKSTASQFMVKARLNQATRDIERQIEEFRGTEQELILTKELLWLLVREPNYDRWLETYLKMVYEHPTHDNVGHFAEEALRISQLIGRQSEVLKAFNLVSSIPLEFKMKQRVSMVAHKADLMAQNIMADPKPTL